MDVVHIWELSDRTSIKLNPKFWKDLMILFYQRYKTRRCAYKSINYKLKISFATFCNLLKESHHKEFFIPLEFCMVLCDRLYIDIYEFEKNILAYKTSNSPNYISSPVLPIQINLLFDMVLAHNIADGTVINPKNGRLPYFGYRQLDLTFRTLYIKKIERIFGKINFSSEYYLQSTRPYCPAVISSLFFKFYNLNTKSFLSLKARIPGKILNKDKNHLLAVLIAFIIDEGNIDSTLITIGLKNIPLTMDLLNICNQLCYKATFKHSGEYARLYILRSGVKKLLEDYELLVQEYPEVSLGKWECKIKDSLKIYNRNIYKTKGNKDLILSLLEKDDLTVNKIAQIINMTRQGVRYHIHNLERGGLISKKDTSITNIIYRNGGEIC